MIIPTQLRPGGLTGLGQSSSSSSALAPLAAAIQTQEGYYPPGTPGYPNGSLAYQNNNPGNLLYVGQAGATPGAGGFAAFPSYSAGYQALLNQLTLDANNGMTVAQVAAQWCPASIPGCNVPAYTTTMASSLGVDPTTPLSDVINGTLDTSTSPSTSQPTDVSTALSNILSGDIDLTDPTTIILIGTSLAAVAFLASRS